MTLPDQPTICIGCDKPITTGQGYYELTGTYTENPGFQITLACHDGCTVQRVMNSVYDA